MAMSNYLEDAIMNAVFRGVDYTSPDAVYIALYTSDPTDADVGTEVPTSGTAYARKEVTFGAPTNGAISNSADIDFDVATSSWGTITHVGVRDASSAGSLLYYGPLEASVAIGIGDQFRILVGQLTLSID